MINSDFYLILLLISLAAAPLVHLIIAYYIAPKRAKAALLDALVHDDQFQTDLIGTIVKNLMRPIKMKNQQGQDVEIVAIDPVLKRGQEHLEYWLKGKQGKMAQEMTLQGADVSEQMMQGQNPLVALALAQVPKKYRQYLNILLAAQNQNQY